MSGLTSVLPVQVKVLSGVESKPVFTPLGVSTTPGPDAPATTAAQHTCAPPVVTLQRVGDKVTGIRIQCGCGQVTELNCVY